jgi:hypothetical protein
MSLLNLFKITLSITCFYRHWSSSGVLQHIRVFVVIRVFSYSIVCLKHSCSKRMCDGATHRKIEAKTQEQQSL